jgi:hypothetical protein
LSAVDIVGDTVLVNATTTTPTFLEPGFSAASDLRAFNFIGTYLRETEPDSFGNAPILHIGAIRGFAPGPYSLVFKGALAQREVQVNTALVRGVAVSLPLGVYSVVLSQTPTTLGQTLCASGNVDVFTVGQGETFVGDLGICDVASRSPPLSEPPRTLTPDFGTDGAPSPRSRTADSFTLSPSKTSTADAGTGGSAALSTGAIVGITIGAVALIAIIAGALVFGRSCLIRRADAATSEKLASAPTGYIPAQWET